MLNIYGIDACYVPTLNKNYHIAAAWSGFKCETRIRLKAHTMYTSNSPLRTGALWYRLENGRLKFGLEREQQRFMQAGIQLKLKIIQILASTLQFP